MEMKHTLSGIRFDKYMCSPLLRTWETASCMLASSGSKKNMGWTLFKRKITKFIWFFYRTTEDDNPDSFHKNQEKYKIFLLFIRRLLQQMERIK